MNTFLDNVAAQHHQQMMQHHMNMEWQHQQQYAPQPCMCPGCQGVMPYFTVPESPFLAPIASPNTPVDFYFQDSPQNLVPPPPLVPPVPSPYQSPLQASFEQQQAMGHNTPTIHNGGACQCESCNMQRQHMAQHESTGAVDYYAASSTTSMQMVAQEQYSPYHDMTPSDNGSSLSRTNSFSTNSFGTHGKRPSTQQREVPVTEDAFQAIIGQMFDIARTSSGSSFLQACLKDRECDRYRVIHAELRPHFAELLLDSHGCYVMRSLMEQMGPEDLEDVLRTLASDEQLTYSLCTHSLHTRRIVQFLLETAKVDACQFIVDVMVKQCREIATTQQGCIAMQRVMDCGNESQRAILYRTIYDHLTEFAHDPFANYVVQYILENGDKATTSDEVWARFKGNVTALACNKFASNVVEKALHHTSLDVQHLIVSELYSNTADFLQNMLQDSFGNYIIQATIALCSFKDVWMISEKLKPILHTTPYGYKIAARLERRLKGKPLTNARTVNYTQSQHLRS